MVSMEENIINDQAASYSWWWHSHNCSHQSQWLQTTLADLDKKTKVMLNLIQEDGDSFAKRAEMYYERKPELIKMVEDFHRSYRSLAEKYDQLRSESIQATRSNSSSASNSLKQNQHLQMYDKPNPENAKPEAPNSHSKDPEVECGLATELMSTEPSKNSKMKPEINGDFKRGMMKKINGTESDDNMGGDHQMGNLEREKMWTELRLKVSILIGDNLQQQDELIRKNEQKREAIKDLCFQINSLVDENRTLKKCLTFSKVDMKQHQSQVPKLKGLFLGKFLD